MKNWSAPLLCILAAMACNFDSGRTIVLKEFSYQVEGPVERDTTFDSGHTLHEKYLLKIKKVSKPIWVPIYSKSGGLIIANTLAVKQIKPDSFLVGGGILDYYPMTTKCLEAGQAYEFSFYLTPFDFQPDTIFIGFHYFSDSLLNDRNTIELCYTGYEPLPHSK
ncbi:MAG: hypothetical protein R2824_13895 [Saprospiraceae bacterium]|nr:hypothetical protein [Lewinella sp.]